MSYINSAKKLGLAALVATAALGFSSAASATSLFNSGLPAGWTCLGNCGTAGADGVVTLAPGGGTQYGWVSTRGGVSGNILADVGGSSTNGSTLRSTLFSANAGDALAFQFDFVTSDGAGYADYAWSRLLDSSLNEVALLFTARTTPSGNSVPGFGMPTIAATISPSTVTIIAGGVSWSPLDPNNSPCYSTGCGYTGWISSSYNILAAGNYYLEFGAANWADTAWQTGMAFDGVTVGGTPIEDNGVPEPVSLALLGIGLAGMGAIRRRKQ